MCCHFRVVGILYKKWKRIDNGKRNLNPNRATLIPHTSNNTATSYDKFIEEYKQSHNKLWNASLILETDLW